jgi:hypothetical protein
MLLRHLRLVRAYLAAGLLSGLMFLGLSIATAQTPGPAPALTPTSAAVDSEPSAAPIAIASETVDLLQARQAGDLSVVARGQGPDRVRLTIRNASPRRLNVIVPPGLVAASKVGQPPGGGRGGLQSIGLGTVTNRQGAFGEFRVAAAPAGLQSIPATGEAPSRSVAVPVGESIELTIPGVCLNFGLPAPSPRDSLTLMDIDTYSTDPRVRTALRSLATLGTSQGVAQAVMWRVCNDVPFETMAEQASKVINLHEIALASRFLDILDGPDSSELIDASALAQSRVFVQVQGQGPLAREAKRLAGQLDTLSVLGLPLQVQLAEDLPNASAPALFLRVILSEAKTGETRGLIVVSTCAEPNAWQPLGRVAFRDNSSVSVLDGATLVKAIDRAIAGAFVTVKPARRTLGSTTLKVENRLPFTVSNLVVKAGSSSGSPSVPFQGIGVGPARTMLLPIQAATASLVEHVDLNGL